MKVNRILFGKISSQYELLKMRAAYVMAERFLMEEEAQNMPPEISQEETNGEWVFTSTMTPEEMRYQEPRFHKPLSEKELVHKKLLMLEHQLKEAEEQEKYEACEILMQAIRKLRKKFINLK